MNLLNNKKIKKSAEEGSFIDFKKYIMTKLKDKVYSDGKLLFLFNKLRGELGLNPVGILNDDEIKGGLSDNLLILDIVKKHFPESVTKDNIKNILDQLKIGIDVEMEHTDNPKVAFEIAMDHLSEMPDYYSKLSTIEERVIAWIDNSSTVDVKDECRLGGGKICNQGDINALNIKKLKK